MLPARDGRSVFTSSCARSRPRTRKSGAGPSTSSPGRAGSAAARSAASAVHRRTGLPGRDLDAHEVAEGRVAQALAALELAAQERLDRVLGREPHDALVGIPGLEHDRARIAAPPAAAGELGEQRERALLAAEVGPREALVGVDRGSQPEIAEVVALGHHLRADEHGGGLAGEALERRLEAPAALGGVGVEAQHGDVRQQLA